MTLYSSQVKKSINYMLRRLGSTIVYKRLQAAGAWSPTGVTDIYWEWPSISAIVYSTTTKDVEESGGRLELGDKAFAFLNSVFTDYTEYEYIKFTSGSVEFMKGELITGATDGATANVVGWYENGGEWTDGDAIGVVWVEGVSGMFNASENLNGSVGGTNMATTTATNTSGGDDAAEPRAGDKIVYGGDTYTVALANLEGGSIIREDITKITTTVYARMVKNE